MGLQTPRRAIELEIERWRIDETGFTQPPYLARFELVWPRPGIDSVKRTLPLPDRLGETVDWTDEDLLNRWLFKEDMEGRMILTASVSPVQARESDNDVKQSVVDLVGQSVARESSITWRTLSDLLELGGEVSQYLMAGPQKTVAEGHVQIEKQRERTLKVPLTAPQPLHNPEPDPTPEDHKFHDDHQDVLKESGESNGFFEIKMSVWNDE